MNKLDKKKYWWLYTLLFLVVVSLCIIMPILLWNDKITLSDASSFIAIFISWPVAILVIVIFFFNKFGSPLDAYIRNIGHMKLPGGVEIQSQTQESKEKTPDEYGNLVLTPEEQEKLNNIITDLESKQNLTNEERKNLEIEFENMSNLALQWKFAYLNLFFVDTTKSVLHWFSTNGHQTKDSFHSAWLHTVQDKSQREVIVNVLIYNGMLEQTEGIIKITSHGYSFLQHIGYIPVNPV